MKKIRKLFNSKLFIAITFFLFGFFTNIYLISHNEKIAHNEASNDRIPVTPEELDPEKMDAHFSKNNIFNDDVDVNAFEMSPNRKEDDKYVYYEIPINKDSKENNLNVEIKDGYIHLKSDSKDSTSSSSMEQVFSIDSNLNDKKAEVLNEKDKIIIKIPKKKV